MIECRVARLEVETGRLEKRRDYSKSWILLPDESATLRSCGRRNTFTSEIA